MCNSPAATIEAPRSTALVLSCIPQTAIQLTRLGPPLFYHIIFPSACPQSPRVIRVVPLSSTLHSLPATSSFLSSSPKGYHSHSSPPLPRAPQCHHSPIPHVRPSSLSVAPDGSSRSLPWPKRLSWPNHLQSQEAVIEAVGGG
jgi:hypothetical protein